MPSDLGAVVRHPRQVVNRELKRLAAAGVIRVMVSGGERRYDADRDKPVSRELSRLIRHSRGRVPKIRHALVGLRSPTLSWAIVTSDHGRDAAPRRARLDLVVLTGAPRSLVRVQLADLVDHTTQIHCLSTREWVTRLDKGDVFLRAARRGQKLWILGSWDALLAQEQAVLESRRLLRKATANWREELSDEWDEDWDPFEPTPRP